MDRFKIRRASTADHEHCVKTQSRSSASTSWKKLFRPTGPPGGKPPSSAPTRQLPDVTQKKKHTAFALRDLPKLDMSEAASLPQGLSRPSPRASRQASSSAVRRGCEKAKSNETTKAKARITVKQTGQTPKSGTVESAVFAHQRLRRRRLSSPCRLSVMEGRGTRRGRGDPHPHQVSPEGPTGQRGVR